MGHHFLIELLLKLPIFGANIFSAEGFLYWILLFLSDVSVELFNYNIYLFNFYWLWRIQPLHRTTTKAVSAPNLKKSPFRHHFVQVGFMKLHLHTKERIQSSMPFIACRNMKWFRFHMTESIPFFFTFLFPTYSFTAFWLLSK